MFDQVTVTFTVTVTFFYGFFRFCGDLIPGPAKRNYFTL